MQAIYLDHNATTPVAPAVWDAMQAVLREGFGNPASAHGTGRRARRYLDEARERVAHCLGAFPDEVIFTSGATEANNLALLGLVPAAPSTILTSPIEHPCVLEPLKQLEARGHAVRFLAVGSDGRVLLPEAGTVTPGLISLMLANHETGAIQPVPELRSLFPGVLFHSDAAQAVGKIPVDFHALGIEALTLSGHKFGGPPGVGALLLRRNTPLRPLLHGGHQQRGQRPGTEPVALAVGLATALSQACTAMDQTANRLTTLRQQLLSQLQATCPPVVVNGPPPGDPHSLPTALNLSFPGCRADVLLMALDLAGVACATGSACSSGSLLPSTVLTAMQIPEALLRSALRFSLGATTTAEEIQRAGAVISQCVQRVRQQ